MNKPRLSLVKKNRSNDKQKKLNIEDTDKNKNNNTHILKKNNEDDLKIKKHIKTNQNTTHQNTINQNTNINNLKNNKSDKDNISKNIHIVVDDGLKIKKGLNKNAFMIDKEIEKIHDLYNSNIKDIEALKFFNDEKILNYLRESYDMDQNDLVSVIIPTYNRFESLCIAIDSVRNQSYKNIEIIVINDASTHEDYSNKSLGDDVIYVNLEQNMRQKYNSLSAHGLTRNEGIKVAKGKWIAFLDDDDYWFPEKIQLQLYFMKKYNYNGCSSNYIKGNGSYNNTITDFRKGLYLDQNVLKELDRDVYHVGAKKFAYTLTSTVILRKDIVEKLGMFRMVDAEDWDLWNRFYQIDKFLFLDITLMYYDLKHAGGRNYIMNKNRPKRE